MKISHISPVTLKDVEQDELLNLHRRMHQLWSQHFARSSVESVSSLVREDVWNAHEMIVDEMQRRNLEHNSPLENSAALAALPDRVTVVPAFVSIVGSTAVHGSRQDGHDLDVLIRSDNLHGRFLIWADNVELPLRKLLDPDKKGFLHFLANPQGPHAESIPLFDLALVRADAARLPLATSTGFRGLYLVDPHAEMIASGKKQAIIKSRPFDLSEPLILLSDDTALGVVVVDDPEELDLDSFARRRKEHRVSEEERKEWWPHAKTLWLYPVSRFYQFNPAIPSPVPRGVQTLVRDVQLATAPLRLDIGCGPRKQPGWLGIDRYWWPGVDVVHDLSRGIPLPADSIDELRAHHILEHLPDPFFAMTEIWRVLKDGGTVDIIVPSTSGPGADAHPGHRSHWNKQTFYFFSNDTLRAETGFLGKFDIISLEEHPAGESIWVYALLRAVKPGSQRTELAISPWYTGPLPKPAMKLYTEFFSVDELWDKWAARRIQDGLMVEEKLNGFRVLAQVKGDQVRLVFEDSRRDRSSAFPDLVAALKKPGRDLILDGNLGVVQAGEPWPRIRLMTLTATRPKLPESATIVFTAFDILYLDGEDLTGLPLIERRKKLLALIKRIGDKRVAASAGSLAYNRPKLQKEARRLAALPGSEGIVVKEADSPYPLSRATSSWAKLKHAVEIKALVLETKKTKAGTHNFRGGLLPGKTSFKNLTEHHGQSYVDLGFSFNAPFSARVGDVVTFEVEEIILQPDGSLAWLGAKPVDVDKTRSQPYYASQVVDLARRGHVLQDARARHPMAAQPTEETEGDTRGARAARFWKQHWQESFPKSGRGQFVYHHHWRGLPDELKDADEDELLKTEHSVHGDLRLSFGPALWGFSVFLGKTSDLASGRDLPTLPSDDALQGKFKLHQPKGWLIIARRKPFRTGPGSVGSTSRKSSAFFEIDHGPYQVGVWREHSFEIFLRGKKLRGRYIISYAPVGNGARTWIIRRPKVQTPFADSHKLEEVVKELRKKGQRWLVWGKPGTKPRLIDVQKEVDA